MELHSYDSYENSFYDIKMFSVLGTNDEQEDAVGCEVNDTSALLVLCDGMGGMRGGKQSARAAVDKVIDLYKTMDWQANPIQFLDKTIEIADEEVFLLKDGYGKRLGGGCTLLIVLMVGRKMYYANVGDSRIYYYDGVSYTQISEDHNYGETLKKLLDTGEIDINEYQEKIVDGAALTGYLGIGEVKQAFVCNAPISIDRNQVLCMQSDGLYKLLTNGEMCRIVACNSRDLDKAGKTLLMEAEEKRTTYQDNTSIILLRLK